MRQTEATLPKNRSAFSQEYQLLACYQHLVREEIKKGEKLLGFFCKEQTLSGVAPVVATSPTLVGPVFIALRKNVPKSYLDDEPAIRRALRLNYDPAAQFSYRAETLRQSGHPVEKIELIILGGTFSFYPRPYREDFIKACFEAANGRKAVSLEEAQRQNEKASQRLIGITIETRPDLIDDGK